MIKLDPKVLDDARTLHSLTSDEQLAALVGCTSVTIRNLRHGRTAPSVATLVRLRAITGRALDGMVTVTEGSPAVPA